MRPRDVNRGRVWAVLHAACKAWGLPGLAGCFKVYFRSRIFYITSRDTRKFDAVGGCRPLRNLIYLQREHWEEDPKDHNDTLVHEAAHIVEYLRYGKCGHGKRHKRLMRSGLKAVERLGVRA